MASHNRTSRSSEIGFYKPMEKLTESLESKDFHILDTEEKKFVFRKNTSRYAEARERGTKVLKRLQQLSISTRCRYELKPDPIEKLTMRLWCQRGVRPNAYICLSYCWNQTNVSTTGPAEIPLPISPLMFSAFAAQRKTESTGLWADQLCIDQKNDSEKTISVGAMDAVYRCADAVVVVLHDVEVYQAQQRFLKAQLQDNGPNWWYDSDGRFKHESADPPIMQQYPVFKRFLYTILGSKYFTRAWCSHELQMRGEYVFLIPCQPSTEGAPHTEIFHFSSDFLLYMIEMSSRLPLSASDVTPSTGEEAGRIRLIRDKVGDMRFHSTTNQSRSGIPTGYDRSSPRFMPSYPVKIREIFGLEAGGDPNISVDLRASSALLDKTTIVLNVLDNGIGVRRRKGQLVTENECMRDLCLMGLAAHDPTILCTMGPHLTDGTVNQKSSWLRRPNWIDLGCGPLRDFPQPHMIPLLSNNIRLDHSPDRRWIELDVFVLIDARPAQQQYRELAARLLDKCLSLDMGRAPSPFMDITGKDEHARFAGKSDLASRFLLFTLEAQSPWGPGPEYRYWYTQTFYGDTRARFKDTVACILQCGWQWILGTASRCGFPVLETVGPKLLEIAFEDGTWDLDRLESMAWASSESGREAVDALFSFANWMVVWGNDSAYGIKSGSLPILFDHGPGSKGNAVVYMFGESRTEIVIPNMLLEDHYSRLYRVWLLGAKDDPLFLKMHLGMGAEWYLRAKAILFTDVMDGDTVALTEARATGRPGWRFRPSVRVHGPPQFVDDEIEKVMKQRTMAR